MNKGELVTHIAELHKCSKTEAEKTIDMFTSSVVDAIGKGNEISLIGFGQFTVSKVEARSGITLKLKSRWKYLLIIN